MKRLLSTSLCIIYLASCTKKDSDTQAGPSSVSFTFTDAGRTNRSDTSVNCDCQFKAVIGGNNGTNMDTTHGYVFSYTGNKYIINFSFEIPRLESGTYSYKAFSTTWPMYLYYDQWMLSNQTFIYTQSAIITIDISRYSKGSLDGTFSLQFNPSSNGTSEVNITNGKLSNIPVK